MPVTDQQLRQELLSFGETVPPITQRNREQLRARLEVLRTQSRSRVAGSPSRSRTTAASPSRSRAAASPSRPLLTGSPSRSRATASPSGSRAAAASPSRSAITSSPSRTRASATTNTSASRPSTRSKPAPGLIELSDSETDSTSADILLSRSTGTGPNVQTRSIALQRQLDSPGSLSTSSGIAGPGNVTNDVEQSIARHRREIKQLLDSAARDRNRATNTSISSIHSGQHEQNEPKRTPVRPSSPSSSSKARTHRQSSASDEDKPKRSPKSDDDKGKKSSSLKRAAKPVQAFWKKYTNLIKNILKALLVGSILFGGVLFLLQKGDSLFPRETVINCSVKNATKCEDMAPVISAVRKQLQVRSGEVDCGFRPKLDILVQRPEIERYLNEKGLKFNVGKEEGWKTLITYILEKPLNDILLWNQTNQETKNVSEVYKLSTPDAIRSLTCRARQDVSKTLRNLVLLVLGSTGLLTLAWYLQRQSKAHEENEKTYKSFLEKVTHLLEDQYEKHLQNPQTQPWLAINHIRDKLIPEEDRERLKNVWERVKKQIGKPDSNIRSESQSNQGEESAVWRWIKSGSSSPKKNQTESPKKSTEQSYVYTSPELGLTECLKLRNFFGPDNRADDDEIDLVVDSIQNRCANIKRIDHIGIHSVFVYLKFSSKEAAGQGYHLLNNWNYHGREINVKYVRLNRYYEHFPEAQDSGTNN